MQPGGPSRPVGARPVASPCPRCGKLLSWRWCAGQDKKYAWRHRKHSNLQGMPCTGEAAETPLYVAVEDRNRPPFDELTITIHAIQMVQKRARIPEPHKCVEWIERVYGLAKWSFFQETPLVRSERVRKKRQKHGLRAPNKPQRVDIFRAPYEDKNWRFFVRGNVLLTVDYEGMDYEDRMLPTNSVKYRHR